MSRMYMSPLANSPLLRREPDTDLSCVHLVRIAIVELGHAGAAGDEDVVARQVERNVVHLRAS